MKSTSRPTRLAIRGSSEYMDLFFCILTWMALILALGLLIGSALFPGQMLSIIIFYLFYGGSV